MRRTEATMKRLLFLAIAGVVFMLHAMAGVACGYCAEDKVASVYDHAVVKKALDGRHHVVFFHIDGVLAGGDAARRALQSSVESVSGVDRGSVRISLETASLSLTFDPSRASLAAVQNALDAKLASKKLSLFLFRVMDRPGELNTAKR
jgi:hypothetical protein